MKRAQSLMRISYILLAAVLLLTGCAAHSQPQTTAMNTQPTLQDIFTYPTSFSTTSPNYTAPTGSVDFGGMGFTMKGEAYNDELGTYRIYEGGQMHLPFSFESTGLIATYDVGILLFVDGIAQPYRVGPNGEYAYMHTFSQKDGTQILGTNTTVADIYFTPITGKQGDVLEIYAVSILSPEFVPSQGTHGFAHTSGSIGCGSRLKYNANPTEDTFPEKLTRLLDLNTVIVDCTYEDISEWSDSDLLRKRECVFTVNDEKLLTFIYGVREDEPVRLHFEVWGTPYVHYGLVFFVDNEPVCAADCADLLVSVEMGKKTIIEAKLDMTGFSGESVVYAVLVPRNYRSSEIDTRAGLFPCCTFYLLEKDA